MESVFENDIVAVVFCQGKCFWHTSENKVQQCLCRSKFVRCVFTFFNSTFWISILFSILVDHVFMKALKILRGFLELRLVHCLCYIIRVSDKHGVLFREYNFQQYVDPYTSFLCFERFFFKSLFYIHIFVLFVSHLYFYFCHLIEEDRYNVLCLSVLLHYCR